MPRIICILLLLYCQCLTAQIKLSGKVLNSHDRKPLPFANVFLSNTTKGTLTNEAGVFELQNLSKESYDLVVSYIGYETLTLKIRPDTLRGSLAVLLEPKANELQEITIKRLRNGHEKYFTLFKENFIGRTVFSESCKLKNPKAVWFTDDEEEGIVNVNADELLVIENKALGYIIKYQLESFTYNFRQNYVTTLGYPFFEEMTTRSERQRRRWAENRKKAYLGSMEHFLRSVYLERTTEEGFTIQKLIRKQRNETAIADSDTTLRKMGSPNFSRYVQYLLKTPLQPNQITQKQGELTQLVFDDFMYIVYEKEDEEPQFLKQISKQNYQVSIFRLVDGATLLSPNGYLPDPLAIVVEGRWGNEKLGELLPTDYLPTEK
ncbi:carboxypeptidase-like regulatory domain-containing protein [Runella sp.]|uniref:carboxypeptidase-like regulatory domain-containing protein n=1 Tax=Runella sp. TaxID=1960881 RepID=UPI003D10B74F